MSSAIWKYTVIRSDVHGNNTEDECHHESEAPLQVVIADAGDAHAPVTGDTTIVVKVEEQPHMYRDPESGTIRSLVKSITNNTDAVMALEGRQPAITAFVEDWEEMHSPMAVDVPYEAAMRVIREALAKEHEVRIITSKLPHYVGDENPPLQERAVIHITRST